MADIKIKRAKLIIKEKVSKNGNPYKTFSLMEGYKIKEQDGSEKWVNYFWDAYIPNADALTNKSVLENIEGFMMGGEYMDRATVKIYVKDYTVTQEGTPNANSQGPDYGFMNVSSGMDEELPFAKPSR